MTKNSTESNNASNMRVVEAWHVVQEIYETGYAMGEGSYEILQDQKIKFTFPTEEEANQKVNKTHIAPFAKEKWVVLPTHVVQYVDNGDVIECGIRKPFDRTEEALREEKTRAQILERDALLKDLGSELTPEQMEKVQRYCRNLSVLANP